MIKNKKTNILLAPNAKKALVSFLQKTGQIKREPIPSPIFFWWFLK